MEDQNKKTTGTGKILWKDRKHVLWFPIGAELYTIKDDERLYIDSGIMNIVSNQTMLYRITDLQLKRSFGQRICGTGTIVLVSKIDADHEIVLKNIKKSKEVTQMISSWIEQSRVRHNMIGKEFFGDGCGLDHHVENEFSGEVTPPMGPPPHNP